jgi:tRNA isopentenyl-2-thiomethyl-A-37 hydroxylase MiaE
LAKSYASDDQVHKRLRELAAEEAHIIAMGDVVPRMHS